MLSDFHLSAWLLERGVACELVITFELWSVVIEVVLRDNIIRFSHVPWLTRLRRVTSIEFVAKKHACFFCNNIVESCVFTLVTLITSGILLWTPRVHKLASICDGWLHWKVRQCLKV